MPRAVQKTAALLFHAAVPSYTYRVMPSRKQKKSGPKTESRPDNAAAVSLVPNLENVSDDRLEGLIVELQAELEQRRQRKRAEFLKTVREQAKEIGLDPEDVARALTRSRGGKARSGRDGRSAVHPKYRDPDDHSRTWSGRGQQPKWLQKEIANGRDINEFRIPE